MTTPPPPSSLPSARPESRIPASTAPRSFRQKPTPSPSPSPKSSPSPSPKQSSPAPTPTPTPTPSTPTTAQGASQPLTSTHLPPGFPDAQLVEDATTLARHPSNTPDSSTSSRRPSTPRSRTDPSLDTMSSYFSQPRSHAAFARSHMRSQSSSASCNAPPMTRAHSLPIVVNTIGHLSLSPSPLPLARPSSPLHSPKRTRSPRGFEPRPALSGPSERYSSGIRPASIGSFEGAPSVCDISEDAELELTPRAASSVSTLYSSTSSLSRRRRPASPLHHMSVSFGGPLTGVPVVGTPTSTSGASSPLLAPSKFNEHYPWSLASSSVPSTPTSMRSRSPSISSLETIEDSPDAEEQAIEAERIARLKAAADREDGGDHRRSSLDVPEGRGRSFGFGKRDSRKRWSVCGAERRVDLSLDTVWED